MWLTVHRLVNGELVESGILPVGHQAPAAAEHDRQADIYAALFDDGAE